MTLAKILTEVKTFIHPEATSPAFTDVAETSVISFINQVIPEVIHMLKDPIHFPGLAVDGEAVTLDDIPTKGIVHKQLSLLAYKFLRPVTLRIVDDDGVYRSAKQIIDPEEFYSYDESNFLSTVDDKEPIFCITGGALVAKPRKTGGRASYFSYISKHTAVESDSTESPFDDIGDRIMMKLIIAKYYEAVTEEDQLAQSLRAEAYQMAGYKSVPILAERGQ